MGKGFKKLTVVFLAYLAIAAIFTYPLIFKLSSSVWGNPGDNSGFLTSGFGGVALEPLVSWTGQLVALLFGNTVAFNLLTFLSFPLAGVTCYCLVEYVGRQMTDVRRQKTEVKDHPTSDIRHPAFVAFVSGLVFSFSPYHFWQSYHHFTLGQVQWLPLFFLALLWFLEKPSAKKSILLGLAWTINFLTNLHYGYFTLLLTGAYLTAKALFEKKSPLQKQTLPGLGIFFVILGVVFLWWHLRLSNSGAPLIGSSFFRPLDDIFALSARPWDYLIPAPNHWLWGDWGQKLLHHIWSLRKDYRYASPFLPERVIYIGVVPLILAGRAILKEKRVWPLALTTLIIFLLSLPPFFDTSYGRLHFPNYLLVHFFPYVRVYARLGVVVGMLVAVLAGLGFTKVKGKRLGVGLGLLLVLEFFLFPHPMY